MNMFAQQAADKFEEAKNLHSPSRAYNCCISVLHDSRKATFPPKEHARSDDQKRRAGLKSTFLFQMKQNVLFVWDQNLSPII